MVALPAPESPVSQITAPRWPSKGARSSGSTRPRCPVRLREAIDNTAYTPSPLVARGLRPVQECGDRRGIFGYTRAMRNGTVVVFLGGALMMACGGGGSG